MKPVPIIDLTASAASLETLDAACREHGFFLLTGHGLDELIEQTWFIVQEFFDADRDLRLSVMRSEANPLGYFDRELTKRRRDHKEVFDFIDPRNERLDSMNQWPVNLPGFRESMVAFFEAFSLLSIRTLELLQDALGLLGADRNLLTSSPTSSTVRLNHYTVGDPVPTSERIGLADLGETALGFHTDPGVLTLLLQDDIGGLQTQALDGSWVDVPPTPGTVVVNLGDCMQAWTNDRYRAAVHRVLPVASRRFSIPYFSNPSRDTIVTPLEQLAEGSPRYRPFAWREFSAARAYDNFTDLGTEDTQVTDFRIE